MGRTASFDAPLLKVSRPVAACSRCRLSKVRCDGKLPACSACERSGRTNECSSANDPFAKGKERSYVISLEARLEKLEKHLAEAKASKPSSALHPFPRPPFDAQTSRRQSGKDRKEKSDIDELVSDFGFLSVNATARDFYGFTSAMSYARLVLSASCRKPIPQSAARPLPPRYQATQLVQQYFDNIFILLPFFSETVFFASVDALYRDVGRHASDMDHWTVRMVLAIAALSLSRSHEDARYEEGVGHAAAGLNFAEKVLHPGSIAGIQATLFLIQYAMLDPHHLDAWYLVGVASRAMVDLGLHEDPPSQIQTNKSVLDMRRRVYYCVFSLDRVISMVQGRAFSFSDESTNVALPSPSSATSSSGLSWNDQLWLQPLTPALYLFRIRLTQSVWYQELFQSDRVAWVNPGHHLSSMTQELGKLRDNMPQSIPGPLSDLFELELQYSHIHLSAPNGKVHIVSETKRYFQFLCCIQYAGKMAAVIRESSPVFYTFYDALRVYFLGGQFLEVLSINFDQIILGNIQEALLSSLDIVSLPPLEAAPNNAARAIRCIEELIEILRMLGVRWGYMTLMEQLKNDSSDMLYRLKQQRDEHTRYSNTEVGQLSRHRQDQVDIDTILLQEWESNTLGVTPTGLPFTNGFSNA